MSNNWYDDKQLLIEFAEWMEASELINTPSEMINLFANPCLFEEEFQLFACDFEDSTESSQYYAITKCKRVSEQLGVAV